MIYKNLIFLIVIFLLNSCNTISDLNYSIKSMTKIYKDDCASNPQKCNNMELCNEAVLSGEWQTRGTYIPFVREAKNRGLSCGVRKKLRKKSRFDNQTNSKSDNYNTPSTCDTEPQKCNDERLCQEATRANKWDNRPLFKGYVTEAKLRGLSCGIHDNQSKNKIDNMLKYALKRLVKLNILSSYQIKNKEQIIQDMASAKFNNLYQLCKNAFANSEPNKCDNAIKELD